MGKSFLQKGSESETHSEQPGPSEGPSNSISSHRGSTYDSKLEIIYDKQEAELFSFQQWHRRMQEAHESRFGSMAIRPKFSLWGWCNCLCTPCRQIEAVDYNKKICTYFLRFRTFKLWTTIFIILGFVYCIFYETIGDDMIPGGTYFYVLAMFLTAFATGSILFSYGIPGNIGQVVIGILFGNLPFQVDEHKIVHVMEITESCMLFIVIIRAALFLDFGHLYGHVPIILLLSILTYSVEFAVIFVYGHYLMELPWVWSALQGVLLTPVSLASAITIMEKSKKVIFDENSKVLTIVIAACSLQTIITIFIYSLLIAIIFPKGFPWAHTWWSLLITTIIELVGGLLIGLILGCLAGMFPDRRSFGAPYFRIMFIGTGTVALVLGFQLMGMTGVGVLSSSTMVVIACNIWEELGWHESANPVTYFYSLLYYFTHPLGVSLAGFSLKIQTLSLEEVLESIGIVVIGTVARELICLGVLQHHTWNATRKEKIFIAVCWLPKGTAEVLLAAVLSSFVRERFNFTTDLYELEELN